VVNSRTSAVSSPRVCRARSRWRRVGRRGIGSHRCDACELGRTLALAPASVAVAARPSPRIIALEEGDAGAAVAVAAAQGMRRVLSRKAILRRTLISESKKNDGGVNKLDRGGRVWTKYSGVYQIMRRVALPNLQPLERANGSTIVFQQVGKRVYRLSPEQLGRRAGRWGEGG
jgi:hypothetical protein